MLPPSELPCVSCTSLQCSQVAGHILELAGARRFKANIVLEGGSIHVDGEGCVATLTDANRPVATLTGNRCPLN